MNSFVNVQVRVLSAQALAQLAAFNSRVGQMGNSFNRASGGASRFSGILNGMALDSFGSRVQWAGRQLEYNFTLPLIAAGASAMKLALDNERAFTRIEKVYGDAQRGAEFYAAELQALQRNFEQLSSSYGVNQTEVLEVAAAWAAAGASGEALAKSVDLTMQTMILGEMKAAEATEALIGIQAQYGFGVADLTKTVATLNMVENQTGISLMGLVQGFQRAAGVARSAGVDVRHLAAMLASLVPATGSASQAGNALKTIFSRLLSPTKETVEVLGLMGINIADLSWKSADMVDRLTIMAKKFEGLSSAQKGVVSSVAASRWQVNKFEVLMRDLLNTHGYYQRALSATRRETDLFNQMNKELQAVLTSNPRRLQIIWTMLQNAAADIIQPLIPLILWLAQGIQTLVTWFSKLPQPVQLTVMALLGLLVIVGPIVRIFGALLLMSAELARGFLFLLAPIKMLSTALMFLIRTPWNLFVAGAGFLVRGTFVALVALVPIIQRAMVGVQIALLTGAAIAGRVWAAGMGALATISAGALAAIGVLYRRAMFYIQAAILAGAAAAGVVWRAGLMALLAIQRAWAVVMAISWSRVFVIMGAIASGGFTAIGALFSRFVVMVRMFSLGIIAALTGPWGIAIATVIALVLAFWDELKAVWSALVRGTINAFNALPRGIHGAMQAVVNIVASAVKAVYQLFSYLNPWARHSPSLVDNVTTGMDEIGRQFSRAANMGKAFKSAYRDMQRFGVALAKLKAASDASEYSDMRKQIRGVDPGAIGSFDRLVRALPKLKAMLASLKPALDAQTAVVDKWQKKLDQANAKLDAQRQILDRLQKVADGYQDQLTAAQSALDGFTSAPIEGMKAMSDAIFENEMQQKRLRLELMKMEEAVGPLDDLQGRIDAINGQIEMLSGKQAELRNAGAGSEILSVYDEQIAALEAQQDAINDQMAPMQNLSKEIDELARKGEMLDLEESLKFDPLKRQIDDVANSMRELPFEQIMAGVVKNKAEVDRLTEAYNKAKAAADKQQAIVDTLTSTRDAIQARYDAESKALQQLQSEYDKYEGQIRDIESALKDAGAAAETLTRARQKAKGGAGGGGGSMSPGAENFLAGAGGNFGDPGGFAQIGREGGLGDQSKMIDDFTKEMARKTSEMFGAFNFLEPIKKGWNTAWGWLKSNVGPAFSELWTEITASVAGASPFEGISSWVDSIKEIGSSIGDAMQFIWDYIGPEVISLGKEAWAGLQDAFAQIQPEIEKFRDLVGPMGEALGRMWGALKPVLAIVLGLILAIVKGLLRGIAGAIGPVIKMISSLVTGIIKVLRGIVEFVAGVFTGDWELVWQGIVSIFSGIWTAIWGVLSNAFKAIWGLLKGFVTGFLGFFKQLYNDLVGNSIVPDMVNEIIAWIASLPSKAWNALVSFGARLVTRAKDGFTKFLQTAQGVWSNIVGWIKGLPDKVFALLNRLVPGLGDKARSAFNTFMSAAKTVWSAILSWLGGRPGEAANKIGAVVRLLGDKGRAAMNTFRDGLSDGWARARDWLSDRASAVKSALGNISLVAIGRAIMKSLLDGLKAAWNETKNFLSGLGSKIKELKGPIEKDRVLLNDEGSAIMQGLGASMRREWGGIEGWLATVSGDIRRTIDASRQLDRMVSYQPAVQQQTLTRGNDGGTLIVNFYGDLEFPNVKSGDDAEEFLSNLEAIVVRR